MALNLRLPGDIPVARFDVVVVLGASTATRGETRRDNVVWFYFAAHTHPSNRKGKTAEQKTVHPPTATLLAAWRGT